VKRGYDKRKNVSGGSGTEKGMGGKREVCKMEYKR
jgi:hypothetical protein